jgi:predicted RNA-binding protein YlxR (DUF448 family)
VTKEKRVLSRARPEEHERPRHAGTRTCAGCGARVAKERVRAELVRVVLAPDGGEGRAFTAHVDLGGSTAGRGAWVHARQKCFEQAAQRGFARSAKAEVHADLPRLAGELREQVERRLRSLLSTAAASGKAAVGSEAACDALRRNAATLVVVARDAAAAAKHREVEAAVQAGLVVAYATKTFLGDALGRGEVGVIALTDEGMAAAIRHTIGLSETFAHS